MALIVEEIALHGNLSGDESAGKLASQGKGRKVLQ
jgi:hypothetical protein